MCNGCNGVTLQYDYKLSTTIDQLTIVNIIIRTILLCAITIAVLSSCSNSTYCYQYVSVKLVKKLHYENDKLVDYTRYKYKLY